MKDDEMKATTPESLREWAIEIRADSPEWGFSANEIEQAADTIESLQQRCAELEEKRKRALEEQATFFERLNERTQRIAALERDLEAQRAYSKQTSNSAGQAVQLWQDGKEHIAVLEAADREALGYLEAATNIKLTPGAIRQQIGYAIEVLSQALTSSEGAGEQHDFDEIGAFGQCGRCGHPRAHPIHGPISAGEGKDG
jgi:DNA repair exonuclease SbcCD ATPase subunit